jgi:uncharacterized protein (DUF302 family)
MRCFSKCVPRSFAESLAITRRALERHGLAIVSQADVRQALQHHVSSEFGPYVILGACCLELTRKALSSDEETSLMLPSSNVVVQQQRGAVEVAAMDPAAMIGALDDVVMIQMAIDLRCRLQAAVDEIAAECAPAPPGRSVSPQRASMEMAG